MKKDDFEQQKEFMDIDMTQLKEKIQKNIVIIECSSNYVLNRTSFMLF